MSSWVDKRVHLLLVLQEVYLVQRGLANLRSYVLALGLGKTLLLFPIWDHNPF